MCDRDESQANLNTYQTCLNYRGKMRYKNYSSKERKKKKKLKQFIPYIMCIYFLTNEIQICTQPELHKSIEINQLLSFMLFTLMGLFGSLGRGSENLFPDVCFCESVWACVRKLFN